MRKTTILQTIVAMMLVLWATCAVAQDVRVNGYDRQDGTHVNSYMRTAPDSTRDNNYSTKGNTNPYTGQAGTKAPDSSYSQPSKSGYGSNPYGGSSHGKRGF